MVKPVLSRTDSYKQQNKYIFLYLLVIIVFSFVLTMTINAYSNTINYKFVEDSNPFITHNQSTCIGKYITSNGTTAIMTEDNCYELVIINEKEYVISYTFKD